LAWGGHATAWGCTYIYTEKHTDGNFKVLTTSTTVKHVYT